MNDTRSAYLKIVPLIFLAGIITGGMQLYRDFQALSHYQRDYDKFFMMEMPVFIVRNLLLWAGIGWALKKWKQAAIAYSIALLTMVLNYFLSKAAFMTGSLFLRTLQSILFNATFLPALVFGFLCFSKRGLLYFLPLALSSFVLPLLFQGSAFLDMSPYNTWYRYLRLDNLIKVNTGVNSYSTLNILSYLFQLASVCLIFIIAGECFYAAAQKKSFRKIFRIDLATRYTGPGALCLFYALRLIINLLVIALYAYPLTYYSNTGFINYKDQSVFTLIITMAAGLGCLIAVVLYYRKFLVEYFITMRQKTSWLFWIVNIPILGMLVFPVIILIANSTTTVEERRLFYFNDNMYYQKPIKILVVMIVLHLVSLLFSPAKNGSSIYWLLWLLELCLLIWYATAVSGYYAILAIGAAGFIFFLVSAYMAVQAYYKAQPGSSGIFNDSPFNNVNISLWLVSAFNLVQYTILLPVFHLQKMRTVQKISY